MRVVTTSGSISATSDGHTTHIYLSADWAGKIECDGPIVVHRGSLRRGWLRWLFGGAEDIVSVSAARPETPARDKSVFQGAFSIREVPSFRLVSST
jgi:hypothetical protein